MNYIVVPQEFTRSGFRLFDTAPGKAKGLAVPVQAMKSYAWVVKV
jgi:hypothetical protein